MEERRVKERRGYKNITLKSHRVLIYDSGGEVLVKEAASICPLEDGDREGGSERWVQKELHVFVSKG